MRCGGDVSGGGLWGLGGVQFVFKVMIQPLFVCLFVFKVEE